MVQGAWRHSNTGHVEDAGVGWGQLESFKYHRQAVVLVHGNRTVQTEPVPAHAVISGARNSFFVARCGDFLLVHDVLLDVRVLPAIVNVSGLTSSNAHGAAVLNTRALATHVHVNCLQVASPTSLKRLWQLCKRVSEARPSSGSKSKRACSH